MRQVLFEIPLNSLLPFLPDIPIYGYGAMLFLAFVFCTWLALRLARREGVPPTLLQDLAIWIFVSGIIGARITFMIQYRRPVNEFYKLWDGGLVFYGSAIGGAIGYFLAYFLFFRKYQVSNWKMADIIAPCAALGLALGRVGCLLNGCCYGNVACADCPHIQFPYPANPVAVLVDRGYQTPAGFTIDPKTQTSIGDVEPGSPAASAGLMPGDRIIKVGENDVATFKELEESLQTPRWPRGKHDMDLTVRRNGNQDMALPAFAPKSLPLHPTQLYETISMALLLFFLVSYYPFKKHDGVIMVLFMFGYGVHRFLNEMLRKDTDPVAFDMTLSQNLSMVLLAAATVLALVIWARSRKFENIPEPVGVSRSSP